MKTIIFTSILCFLFVSCQKRKEIKEWKKKEGGYFSEESYLIYQDQYFMLEFNEVNINASGATLFSSTENSRSVNFSVYHKSHNENPNYQYKLQFSSITGFEITSQGATNQQISFDQFTAGREFYLSFSDNNLTFTIINPDGAIDNLLFQKK